MHEAIPPPQYAFMEWYSVKTQGQIYLYFTLHLNGLQTHETSRAVLIFCRVVDSRLKNGI